MLARPSVLTLRSASRSELEEAYARAKPGGYWFSPGTLRFFRSRIHSVHRVEGTGQWLFVSSEQGPRGPRAYTVRIMDDDGDIRNLGEFMGYATSRQALAALRKFARGD